MPIVSRAQLRYCYFLANQQRKKGQEPTWNCHESYHQGEPYSKLPEYISDSRKTSRKPSRTSSRKTSRKSSRKSSRKPSRKRL